jgi:hypothetical protein
LSYLFAFEIWWWLGRLSVAGTVPPISNSTTSMKEQKNLYKWKLMMIKTITTTTITIITGCLMMFNRDEVLMYHMEWRDKSYIPRFVLYCLTINTKSPDRNLNDYKRMQLQFTREITFKRDDWFSAFENKRSMHKHTTIGKFKPSLTKKDKQLVSRV